METLNRAGLLAIPKKGPLLVALESGNTYVRAISLKERTEFELAMFGADGQRDPNLRARLIILCACDEVGKRILDDDDVNMIGGMDTAALEPVFDAAAKHNCLLHHAGDAEKNSAKAPS